MDRAGKAKLKDEIGERLSRADAVVLTEYRGLTVDEVSQLRSKLRECGAEYKVSKNRIAKLAVRETENFKDLEDQLTGPVGLVYMYEDPAAASKAVLEFGKGNEKFVIRDGMMDGKPLTKNDMKALADLPSKEVLLGQIVGSLVSPHRGLVTTLSGVSRNLVQVINAIKDTKQA